MKKILIITCLLWTFLLNAQPKSPCSDLEGVWQYDLPNERGMWFCSNNRYLWVLIPKERKPFAADQLSPEEKATAFDYLNSSTGSMICDGKRVTVTHLYTKNPKETGQSFQFEYEKKDGKIKYWIIQPDGSRGPEGNSKKIADFKPATNKGCDQMNGFWEYELPDQYGVFAYSSGYFGWILVDKEYWNSKPDIGSAEIKSKGFDYLTVDSGTATCDDKQRYTWKREHAKDYRAEKSLFSSDSKFEKDLIQWWYVDQDGKKLETGGIAKRIK